MTSRYGEFILKCSGCSKTITSSNEDLEGNMIGKSPLNDYWSTCSKPDCIGKLIIREMSDW